MDFDNFDTEDAIMVGGMMGFAEESMSAENDIEELNESILDEIDIDKMPLNLRQYARACPEQFKHILKIVIQHSKDRKQEIMDREAARFDPETSED